MSIGLYLVFVSQVIFSESFPGAQGPVARRREEITCQGAVYVRYASRCDVL